MDILVYITQKKYLYDILLRAIRSDFKHVAEDPNRAQISVIRQLKVKSKVKVKVYRELIPSPSMEKCISQLDEKIKTVKRNQFSEFE